MKTHPTFLTLSWLLLAPLGLAAAPVQVLDLRPAGLPTSLTRYEQTPVFQTQPLSGAPVKLEGSVFAVSGAYDGKVDENDVALRWLASGSIFQIERLSRAKTTRVPTFTSRHCGAMQWSFSLAPVATYLTEKKLELTTLSLNLALILESTQTGNGAVDVLLSYGHL